MNCIRYGLFACSLLFSTQAYAANYVRYTATATGAGSETVGITPTGYDFRQIQGLEIIFTVEFNDGASYGSIVGADKYIFTGAGLTGIGFGTQGAPTYGFDGSATFVFDNPSSTFPVGPILLDNGRSLINVSYGTTNGFGFRFSGNATSLTSTVGSANDRLNITTIVPEPSTWALMLAGFGMVGYAMRRRKLAFA